MAARRRTSGLEALAAMPWPVGIGLGIAGFLLVRYGAPWYFSQDSSAISKAFAQGLANGPVQVFSWVVLLICWLGAGLSYIKQRQRARLFDAQSKTLELSALSWRQFESLVAEWFHRQGYQVVETGGGGPDGGIDLILRKGGRKELVQCKHWKRRQVSVTTVREMWGLLQHHQADGVWIVCTGEFTADAATFAAGKPVHLVTGAQLGSLMQEISAGAQPSPFSEEVPAPSLTCPRCGRGMVERQNRRTGDRFFGCETYPACKGTSAKP
ncbi:restriction endonuclease [Arenimonas terrae]|uniref:Restriction endonuclease n=1 Tax=Arenimonas terrae TaxID=2546226 RepID=A0A5C4RV76_9GAMM|nr:restriction endonuclease [Arenimonas terrae]TNJ34832.1 restriction endonuclease [Arenimonas terrae]